MQSRIRRVIPTAVACALVVAVAGSTRPAANAETMEWPQEIDLAAGKVVIYQPQPETFKDDKLTARAAVSVTTKDKPGPVFGAVWIEARVSTDRDTRTVTILDIKVPKVRFPNATQDQAKQLAALLEKRLPATHLTVSLDRLLAGLALADKAQVAAASLSVTPPQIIFSTTPAVLITIDGKPQLQQVGESKVMRVVNTPFVILFDTMSMAFYLKGGDLWMTAPDVMGPWRKADAVPVSVLAVVPAGSAAASQPAAAPPPAAAVAPRVIVATEPTELIVANGTPTWTPIDGSQLLYMSNTESDVFMDVPSRQYYVLLAGRWYTGPSSNGPWKFVPANTLPPSFARIPPDSPKGRVLANVAGTEQAIAAVLDASVPQTAAIKRSEATLTVSYDGDPRFEAIEGTEMSYAVNTASSVIRAEGRYYCCSQAVWYSSDSPTGPWTVCTSVPKVIYTIPPSCPLYNVGSVSVYDSTPEEVYVGYLPGYTGSYVYGGTVVYGTGYWYPGWFGTEYYPRPWTWGFDPVYYPWTGGWYYGVGPWGHGWAFWNGHGGWWGPGGYHSWGYLADRYGASVGDGKVTIGGKTYTRDELRDMVRRGEIDGKKVSAGDGKITIGDKTFSRGELRDNIYKRENNAPRTVDLARTRSLQASKVAVGLDNDVFADRNGNVYRLKDGWEQYGRDGWAKSFAPSAGEGAREVSRPADAGVERRDFGGRSITQIQGLSRPAVSDIGERQVSFPASGFDRRDLDSQSYARQWGAERADNFQRSYADRSNLGGGLDRGDFGRAGGGFGGRDFGGGRQSFGGGRPSFGGGRGGGFGGGRGGRR